MDVDGFGRAFSVVIYLSEDLHHQVGVRGHVVHPSAFHGKRFGVVVVVVTEQHRAVRFFPDFDLPAVQGFLAGERGLDGHGLAAVELLPFGGRGDLNGDFVAVVVVIFFASVDGQQAEQGKSGEEEGCDVFFHNCCVG